MKIGETEHIENNLNPDFQTAIAVDYHFEKLQKLKFVMNDIDDDEGKTYDIIGELETTLGAIMHARKMTFMDRLIYQGNEKRNGVLIVRAELVEETNDTAKFRLQWSNVNTRTGGCFSMCRRRQAYRYTIERPVPGTKKFAVVKKSYPHKKTSIEKPPFEIHFLSELCNNNRDAPIKFGLRLDNLDQTEIDSVTTTINQLQSGNTSLSGNGAKLDVIDFEIQARSNFANYVKEGLNI